MSDIQPRKLNLFDSDESVHRPNLRIWADDENGDETLVTMTIGALHGEQMRFVEMTPDEARTLATLLKQVADDIGRTANEETS